MFKKTLIAAALASTALTAAASTVTVTPATVGVEYAAGIQILDAATISVELGRNYASGDIITVTIAGADLTTSVGSPAAAVTPVVGGALAGSLEFLDYQSNTVRLLVNADIDVSADDTFTLAGLKVNVAGAVNKGKVTVTAAGRVDTVDGAINVDAAKAVDYITFATEYSSKINDAFDAVIDVNTAREDFVASSGADSVRADTLVLEHVRATPTGGATSATGVTYTVNGDFSFLDADGDGDLGDKGDGSITSTGGTVKVADDFQSVTVTDATGATFAASGTVGVTVSTPGDVVIPDQAYTADVAVTYTWAAGGNTNASAAPAGGVSKTTADGAAAGSWTLNGAKAHIPFLPFGSNFSQAVTISNTSTQAGGVDLVIYTGGETVSVEGIATAGAQGVTDISAAVRQAVADAGLSSGAYSFDVIINAPDASITVEALYYARSDADRLRTL